MSSAIRAPIYAHDVSSQVYPPRSRLRRAREVNGGEPARVQKKAAEGREHVRPYHLPGRIDPTDSDSKDSAGDIDVRESVSVERKAVPATLSIHVGSGDLTLGIDSKGKVLSAPGKSIVDTAWAHVGAYSFCSLRWLSAASPFKAGSGPPAVEAGSHSPSSPRTSSRPRIVKVIEIRRFVIALL